MKGAKKLQGQVDRILQKFKFKRFKLERKGKHIRLYGEVNPWVLLIDGELRDIKEQNLEKELKKLELDGKKPIKLSDEEFEKFNDLEIAQRADIYKNVVVNGGKLDLASIKRSRSTYTPVEFNGTTRVDGQVKDISRRIYQRGDINWAQVDPETGLTNLQLMKKGRPPYWKDGTKIELHHTIQLEPGPMVELSASLHDEYSKILHVLVENGGSLRNNPVLEKQYNNFRAKYWRMRAKGITAIE